MADGESVEDQLDDLRTQWIELSDEIAPNISPIGEAPGLIRGKLVDLVEANDADRIGARFRPPAPPVRSDRRGKATIPNRPHLIVIIWHCPARQRRVPRPGLPVGAGVPGDRHRDGPVSWVLDPRGPWPGEPRRGQRLFAVEAVVWLSVPTIHQVPPLPCPVRCPAAVSEAK